MNKILIIIICFLSFCSCTEIAKKYVAEKKKEKMYASWQTFKDENIEFKYPKGWYALPVKDSTGNTQIGITNVKSLETIFFPVEIWYFSSSLGSYTDFSRSVPNDYFVKRVDGEFASLFQTDTIKVQNHEAHRFDYKKKEQRVQITTVKGNAKYYMLVNYKFEGAEEITDGIISSVNILK